MRERGMRNMLGKGLSSCLGFAELTLQLSHGESSASSLEVPGDHV